MTTLRAPAPLDLTLLAVAGGIALAWQGAPPLWLLPRLTRYPALALLAALWMHSPWQYTAPIAVESRCVAILRVGDFPARGYPVGSRFTAVITAPGDCPLATGDRLTFNDYQPVARQPGDTLRARLHLKPGNDSAANQRQRLRGYAAINNAETVADAPVPWLIRQRLALGHLLHPGP